MITQSAYLLRNQQHGCVKVEAENPAEHIIRKIGGLTKVAKLLSSDERQFAVSTVQGWKVRGKIPQEHWKTIIEAARADGVDISIDMFLDLPEAAQ